MRRYALLTIPFSAAALAAQVNAAGSNVKLRAALDVIKADNAWTLDQQVSICEIPAPPFKESVRGAEYKRRLESLGMRNVRIDSVGNVIAERRGSGTGPVVRCQQAFSSPSMPPTQSYSLGRRQ